MTVLALQSIHFSNGKVLGYEVLARRIVSGRMLSPGQFMANSQPGEWILLDREIVTLVADNIAELSGIGPLFINISAETLTSISDAKSLIKALAGVCSLGLEIVLEISEKYSDGAESLDSLLLFARSLGLGVAIDDFGSDNSNMARLVGHKWDYCKIDLPALLVPTNLALLTEIRDYCMANHVGLILEKVEDVSILSGWLKPLNGASLQGFALSKPDVLNRAPSLSQSSR